MQKCTNHFQLNQTAAAVVLISRERMRRVTGVSGEPERENEGFIKLPYVLNSVGARKEGVRKNE